MKELVIGARTDNLDQVIAFVDENLEEADCSMKAQMQIDVAVEEIFVNIAQYAYTPAEEIYSNASNSKIRDSTPERLFLSSFSSCGAVVVSSLPSRAKISSDPLAFCSILSIASSTQIKYFS